MRSILGRLKGLQNDLNIGVLHDKVIIHFWSPVCVDCLRDVEYLNLNHRSLSNVADVIGVIVPKFSFDYETLFKQVMRLNINYKVALADDFFFRALNLNSCHEFAVLSASGHLLYRQQGGGYYWLETALVDLTGMGDRVGSNRVKRLLEDFEAANSSSLVSSDWTAACGRRLSFRVTGEYESRGDVLYIKKGRIDFYYRGRRVYALMGPKVTSSSIEVRLNGHPLRSHVMGDDVTRNNGRTMIHLDVTRLYNIIDGGWGEYHLTFEINQECIFYALMVR
jgi:hypothetical protein